MIALDFQLYIENHSLPLSYCTTYYKSHLTFCNIKFEITLKLQFQITLRISEGDFGINVQKITCKSITILLV